jgi:hypothetical protein
MVTFREKRFIRACRVVGGRGGLEELPFPGLWLEVSRLVSMKRPLDLAFPGPLAETVGRPEVDIFQLQKVPGEALQADRKDLRVAMDGLRCGLEIHGGQNGPGAHRRNFGSTQLQLDGYGAEEHGRGCLG